ncbi:beta-glucosidase 13-like isoform X1 [Chenopodium quinoa]|uniref:beta-glucosidase 13-like isoform X1 n=2 Tax=Chenopodium quinoa TaxID=63459 RepID=UPI000B799773|nr:beta-glucosidase 13-like isoform X1 [Chenopodium quinoa]
MKIIMTMKVQTNVFLVLLSLLLFMLGNSIGCREINNVVRADYGINLLNRSSFSAGFLFGTASSAYQYEGAAHEDGRGSSIWDTYTQKYPDKIKDRSNGDVAIDSYHRYKEDVKLMKKMGLDAYRFSISWSRILPYGKLHKGVNQKGLAYYHNLIDELIVNGIKPFVTLFHWDLPQALEAEYGGFLSPYIVDDFRDYANICFKEFGDKVKHWITLNEPWSYIYGGYASGRLAPGRCSKWQQLNCTGGDSATEPYLVSHHQLLAHAAAVDLYRRKYKASQQGILGISLVTNWFVPLSKIQHHKFAAMRALDFMLGWFMDPITKGEYPHSMRSLVRGRLPEFSAEQSRMLNGSYDFLGLNYYSSRYAAYSPGLKHAKLSYTTDANVRQTVERKGIPIGPKAASDWLYVYPQGIRYLLVHIKRRYNNPLIYITENGVDEVNNGTLSLKEALRDEMRVRYYHDHLAFLHLAIKEGVNVKGYFAWSLLDNFEWSSGYTVRFGINYVDYKDGLKRYPKLSAFWFKKFLRNRK